MGEDQAAAKKEAREKAEEKKKKVKKGKKARKNKPASQKYKFYDKTGKKIESAKFCPRCGPGVFLGNMGNRQYCGKCGWTEFIGKKEVKGE